MKRTIVILSLLLSVFSLPAQEMEPISDAQKRDSTIKTQIIAHRGFWDSTGSAQNSITALTLAHQTGVYGSEFDVCITSDGAPVINHDNDIQGYVIADSRYSTIMNLQLSNGEKLPTLKKYLRKGKELALENISEGIPPTVLILELKPCSTPELEDRAVEIVSKIVRKEMLPPGSIEFISFSMNICRKFAKLFPDAKVAYLGGELSPAELLANGIWNLDYNYSYFHNHPEWVSQAHQLGMKVNVWTVDDIGKMQEMIDLGVDYITTNKPLELKELLK